MLVLLSPAKTLDFETPPTVEANSKARFLEDSQELIDQLQHLKSAEVGKLMSVSEKISELNVQRFNSWKTPFTPNNAKPAAMAFRGDVYQGLDADTLSSDDFEFAQSSVRILSGLYGILRPLDLIQPYRLEMGTRFANKRGSNLYKFWGDRLTQSLNQEITADKHTAVINLASNEYFKAVKAPQLQAPLITPAFRDWKNGEYKMISFFAKKARGMMTRYVVDQRLESPEALKQFDTGGYAYCEAESTADTWVFLRRQD